MKEGHFRGVWKNGTFGSKNAYSVFEWGTWYNGIFENGDWHNGTWKDGIWYDGVNSIWENGTWIKGRNQYGDICNFPPNSEKWADWI